MTAIVVNGFGGMMPRLDPFALPPNSAQIAEDCRLHAGVLRGFRRPASLDPTVLVDPATQALFYDDVGSKWYSWTSEVDVAVGPVADPDGNRRYYYTGDGLPKKTDAVLGATGASGYYPRSWLYMGVPAPNAAPTYTNDNAGAGTAEDHVYVTTYVSTFSDIEEESAPSLPLTVTAWQPGDTITITRNTTAPTTGYNITHWRIYRSNGGPFYFVGQQVIGTNTYADNKLNDALGEEISSTYFEEPPTDMHSLVVLPNGSLAGISGNEVCFSEPYQPHAWPPAYRKPIPDIPVGLIALAQGVFIATKGRPALCSGVHPTGMTIEWSPKIAPCVSRRSLVTDGSGVMYASYSGLAYVLGTQVTTPTEKILTVEEWQEYTPSSMIGAYHADRYYLWYTTNGTQAGLLFDKVVPEAPFTKSQFNFDAYAILPATGKLYVADGGEVKETDADTSSTRISYRWRSKEFVIPRPVNFNYAQVLFTGDLAGAQVDITEALAFNASIWDTEDAQGDLLDLDWNEADVNGSLLIDTEAVQAGAEFVTFNVYADGVLKLSRTVTSERPFRLPAGFKSKNWELEILGNATVRQATLATSIEELNAQ